jgi:hypothetical protein
MFYFAMVRLTCALVATKRYLAKPPPRRDVVLAVVLEEPEADVGDGSEIEPDELLQLLLRHCPLALVHEVDDKGRPPHLAGTAHPAEQLAAINDDRLDLGPAVQPLRDVARHPVRIFEP